MSLPTLTKSSDFSLDFGGVTSLLGGDDALSALTAVHVYQNWRCLGLYNTPGSFQVSKRLNSLAKASPSNTLSNGVYVDLTTLFEPDRSKWPKFRGARSGTVIEETGYLATLFIKGCADWHLKATVISGRKTRPVDITIADLGPTPPHEMYAARDSSSTPFIASIPIFFSIGACVVCALWGDRYAASLIFVGIFASGLLGFTLGSADFVFAHPKPAAGSPDGDGIFRSDTAFVLLRGEEGAVNSITRGTFSLRFSSVDHFRRIHLCSFFFLVQGITQLFLIPQASLFGQVAFLISLGVSALYNARLSSLDKEKIHREMLFKQVLRNPTLTKYTFGTYTTSVVFILLVLQLEEPNDLLNELLPNNTQVWTLWKGTILEWLRNWNNNDPSFSLRRTSNLGRFSQKEKELLELLYEDARSAFTGYQHYRRSGALAPVASDV